MSHSFYILKKRIIIIAFLEKSREVQNLTKITRSLAIIVYFEENVVEKWQNRIRKWGETNVRDDGKELKLRKQKPLWLLLKFVETVFSSAIQTPRISSKILNVLRVVFSTLFLMLGYPDETLSLVFDILHTNQANATWKQIHFLKTDTFHNYAQRDRGR